MTSSTVSLRKVVLDATDIRAVAKFYRRLLGFRYRRGDETPPPGKPDPKRADWLVLRNPAGGASLAFAQVAEPPAVTWTSTCRTSGR